MQRRSMPAMSKLTQRQRAVGRQDIRGRRREFASTCLVHVHVCDAQCHRQQGPASSSAALALAPASVEIFASCVVLFDVAGGRRQLRWYGHVVASELLRLLL
jgi:hypothetical protein